MQAFFDGPEQPDNSQGESENTDAKTEGGGVQAEQNSAKESPENTQDTSKKNSELLTPDDASETRNGQVISPLRENLSEPIKQALKNLASKRGVQDTPDQETEN